MGAGASRLDRVLEDLPEGERYFGLENFGNTCYCNSVLQALYFCRPFRARVLARAAAPLPPLPSRGGSNPAREPLLDALAELFASIAAQRRRSGCVAPRRFVTRVRAQNELFAGLQHQDAHEFLSYLLNDVAETLVVEARRGGGSGGGGMSSDGGGAPADAALGAPAARPLLSLGKAAAAAAAAAAGFVGATVAPKPPPPPRPPAPALHHRTPSLQALHQAQAAADGANGGGASNGGTNGAAANPATPPRTWVDELFRGTLASETRCLRCEAATTREEPFYDLSLEIEPNASVTGCLARFAATETLAGPDKFFCDGCGCPQEAARRLRVAAAPPVLCLHLKRFKYVEAAGGMRKLAHRVAFPFTLRLGASCAAAGAPGADEPYALSAVVVHMGAHVHHGHYVALVKSAGRWLCFDDEAAHAVSEAQVRSTFGAPGEAGARGGAGAPGAHADHAYILFYERVEEGAEGADGEGAVDVEAEVAPKPSS
jgi:ubiquitin C-terminal hydrolase